MTPQPAHILAQADPDTIRRTVDEVLAGRDYADAGVGERGPVAEGLNALGDRIGRWLLESGILDLFGGPAPLGETARGAAWIVGIMVLIVAATLGLTWWRRRRNRQDVLDLPTGRSGRDWAEEAQAHEDAGELLQALRCRYAETLARLATARLISEVQGTTTGEYLAIVQRRLPRAITPFTSLTHAFEDGWYGGRAVTHDVLADAIADRDAVLDAAGLRARLGIGA